MSAISSCKRICRYDVSGQYSCADNSQQSTGGVRHHQQQQREAFSVVSQPGWATPDGRPPPYRDAIHPARPGAQNASRPFYLHEFDRPIAGVDDDG
jgi:hypothetical protein